VVPPNRTTPQFKYQAGVEDQRLVDELLTWLLNGKLVQTTPAHILTASVPVRKELYKRLRNRRVEATSFEQASTSYDSPTSEPTQARTPKFALPLREVDVIVNGLTVEAGVLDSGSQIIAIREDLAREVQAQINEDRQLEMEVASCGVSRTVGCTEYLPMQIGDIPFTVHTHVVKRALFCLLLG
jgi:hypothetical protein